MQNMRHRQLAWAALGIVSIAVLFLALGPTGYRLGQAAGRASATFTPFVEPEECREPPDDYHRVWVNGVELNVRTLAMLDHAQAIYDTHGGSVVDFRLALTQGSYTGGAVSASFGTHDGGGALDLSVRSREDWSVMEAEIGPMIEALRLAGFAAWVRQADELYPGSPIHIHAIAIGDKELSEAARGQIDGPFGYLRGFNGLPQEEGQPPVADPHGGPVICGWMVQQGFQDLRTATPAFIF